MKKILKNLSLCLILVVLVFTMFACSKDNQLNAKDDVKKKDCVLVEKELELTLYIPDVFETFEGKYASSYLDFLAEKKYITYEATDSSYGKYIVSINGREADSTKNEYWAIYTSNTAPEISSTYSTCKYGEITLQSANFGISSLPIKAKEYLSFRLETY